MVDCYKIAATISASARLQDITKPIVCRLKGHGSLEGQLLKEDLAANKGIEIHFITDWEDAVVKAIEIANRDN